MSDIEQLTDMEVINRFKEMISWGDETRIIQHGERNFLKTDVCIYYPVRWDALILQELQTLQNFYGRDITALIWGNPTHDQATQIFWACTYAGFATTFVDPVGRVAWSSAITSALDGVDWNRTLQAIATNGSTAKPIYEWDDDDV